MKWNFFPRLFSPSPINQMNVELILLILFSHFLGRTLQWYLQQNSSTMLVASDLEKNKSSRVF